MEIHFICVLIVPSFNRLLGNNVYLPTFEAMGKFGKALKAFAAIARKPYLLNLVLDRDEEWQKYIAKKYPGKENGFNLVDPLTLFPDFNFLVEPYAFLDGGSLPTDLGLLMKFADSIENCSYFEIGTWRGESVANVARFASTCYTLNLTDDELRHLGMSEAYIAQQGLFSKSLDNVVHLRGNSLEFDFSSIGKKFDLIFIDGDHHHAAVRHDTMQVFRHLVHENSVVIWHDVAHNPEQPRYEVIAGILDGISQELHDKIFHLSHSKSAFYSGRTHPSSKPEFPLQSGTSFRVKVNSGPLTDN